MTVKAAVRLEDPTFAVRSYSSEIDDSTGEIRIAMYAGPNQTGEMLGYWLMVTQEAYEFSAHLLHLYDKLERI